ncbi:alpha/beta hydrolase family protein [Natrinema longum]|uniref:Dienelactone hydrolase family protein n=1 Tax=Natrinema longum TaxID=370324 RepID=A0A8A2U956_9EURY|nr:dienelactone hydrolase family protein [Natrinema longum]MBZ6493488.1 dienelactone hydrolase family protein [Natrinema longum]QSW85164.1 dienelactone hydrolase family protein [Natrinema longum]
MAPRRRTVLAAVSTATASAVAGCAGLLSDTTDEDPGTETADETAVAFVEELATDRFEQASERFVSGNRERYGDPGRLERLWMAYTAIGGAFDDVVDTDVTTSNEVDAVDLRLSFARSEHDCRVIVDSESRLLDCGITDEYERPSYVDSSAVTDEDVTLAADDCSLPGTVTTPATAGEAPGVVLVHDSGPVTGDTARGGTQLFTDLAAGLSTRGIASLRYDKRVPACEVQSGTYTLDHVTVDDALVAIDRLRSTEGVDSDRIVVVGHGLGGRAAPRIAARDGELAGVVGLAAPARPYHDLTLEQLEYKVSVGDHGWADLEQVLETWSTEIERVRSGEYEADETLLGKPGAFWDSLESYDHLGAAADVDAPLYLLQGERDFQVTVTDDLELWRSELDGRSETTFESYDGLNHLFMPGDGESVEFAYAVRNNVAERVVADLVDWIDDL